VKILHIITSLNSGGAQNVMSRLLSASRQDVVKSEVINLSGEAPLADAIRRLGVPVTSLGMSGSVAAARSLRRIGGLIRNSRPDVVQCWMYHANLLGGLATWLYGHMPVVWNIRQSTFHPSLSKRRTRLVADVGSHLSSWLPRRIICVSEAARLAHRDMGYLDERMIVIENGFDVAQFRPNALARVAIRAELGIDSDMPLVGLVARFDPQKDVRTFLRAASCVLRSYPDVHFVLCGAGMETGNLELQRLIAACKLVGRIHLLGERQDIAAVTAAFDVATSSSLFGEGFSNTLGEALCCGVPAVATDVGAAREILGEEGRLVRPQDSSGLASAIEELIAIGPEGRRRLGAQGRAHMERHFSAAAIAERYNELYADVCESFAAGEAP
jgi:glycosyltransferase involved in cell wall biosynthesis